MSWLFLRLCKAVGPFDNPLPPAVLWLALFVVDIGGGIWLVQKAFGLN